MKRPLHGQIAINAMEKFRKKYDGKPILTEVENLIDLHTTWYAIVFLRNMPELLVKKKVKQEVS